MRTDGKLIIVHPLHLTLYPVPHFYPFRHVAAMVWYTFCEIYDKDGAPDICRCDVGGVVASGIAGAMLSMSSL